MIISVHIPKAGGTSFRKLLENNFGNGFVGDYKDIPVNKSPEYRAADAHHFIKKFNYLKRMGYWLKGVKCIHGHFLPFKYKQFLNDDRAIFITWLREPFERLVSHYYYWMKTYDEKTAEPLHKKVVEEKWTLEMFCLSKEMQNMYAAFFWNFPLERFDFIGITESFDEDVLYFSKHYLGKQIVDIPVENVNENKETAAFKDAAWIQQVKKFHAEDYRIYNYALQKRNERSLNNI